jgi:hypothetical protein
MNHDKIKQIAVGGSAVAMAIAMALQTFVFGQSDIQVLKAEVAQLSKRVIKLEEPQNRE